MLLVLEAGLDVDLDMLKLIGLRGIAIAVSGSFGPLILGWLLSTFGLGLDWKSALAVGCTLAPTSMGIALNVLKQAKLLNTPTGQLIIAAAVLDDVIALLLLSELQARAARARARPFSPRSLFAGPADAARPRGFPGPSHRRRAKPLSPGRARAPRP